MTDGPAEDANLTPVDSDAAARTPSIDPNNERDADPDLSASTAAFKALGSEIRLAVLTTLREASDAGRVPLAFSDLFAAAPVDTTAGFAYHLRQLADRFVRETEGGYVLTDAGRRVARALASGAYERSPTLPETPLDVDCPRCDASALAARSTDGTYAVMCSACERQVLTLPVPPGADSHAPDSMPTAFERHHRHRLSAFADGVCPDCGGRVTGEMRAVENSPLSPGESEAEPAEPSDSLATSDPDRVQVERVCQACGASVAAPVPLFLLDHPEVVSFYRDHGVDLRERPLWNVGPEWAAGVLSEDPWAIRVASELDDERLRLLVGEDLSVVDSDRRAS